MTETPEPEPPDPSTLALFTPPYLNPGGAAAGPSRPRHPANPDLTICEDMT